MPRWLAVVAWIAGLLVAVALLFTVVFPWVEQRLEDPTMGVRGGPAGAAQLARAPR